MAEKLTTFSTRSNAKRAAEKAIATGTAPSIDYGIKGHASGRFQISWHRNGGTEEVPTTEQVAEEIATATAEAEAEPITEAAPSAEFSDEEPDPWPPGTRVQVGRVASGACVADPIGRVCHHQVRLDAAEYALDVH